MHAFRVLRCCAVLHGRCNRARFPSAGAVLCYTGGVTVHAFLVLRCCAVLHGRCNRARFPSAQVLCCVTREV